MSNSSEKAVAPGPVNVAEEERPQPIDITETSQLIFHLVRLGANGDSKSARNVGMLASDAIRKLRALGQSEDADNLIRALEEAGYVPRIWRNSDSKGQLVKQ
jgi:hypothetical protein